MKVKIWQKKKQFSDDLISDEANPLFLFQMPLSYNIYQVFNVLLNFSTKSKFAKIQTKATTQFHIFCE